MKLWCKCECLKGVDRQAGATHCMQQGQSIILKKYFGKTWKIFEAMISRLGRETAKINNWSSSGAKMPYVLVK